MAIIINGLLQGRLGNKIFCIRNGKNYSRPVRKKTTPPTQKQIARQAIFARTIALCKALKPPFLQIMRLTEYSTVQTNMMSSLVHWVAGYAMQGSAITGTEFCFHQCNFTTHKPVKEYWRVPLTVRQADEGLLQLHIPAFTPKKDLYAPGHTAEVLYKVIASGCSAADGTPTGSYATMDFILHNDEAMAEQWIDLYVPTPKGTLLLIAMSLEFTLEKAGGLRDNLDEKFMPAGIIDALYIP